MKHIQAEQIYQKIGREGEEQIDVVGGLIGYVSSAKPIPENVGIKVEPIVDRSELWTGEMVKLSIHEKVACELGFVHTAQFISFLHSAIVTAAKRDADCDSDMEHKDVVLEERWSLGRPKRVMEKFSLQRTPGSGLPMRTEVTAQDASWEESLRVETLSPEEIMSRTDGHSIRLVIDNYQTTLKASACSWLIDQLLYALLEAFAGKRQIEPEV